MGHSRPESLRTLSKLKAGVGALSNCLGVGGGGGGHAATPAAPSVCGIPRFIHAIRLRPIKVGSRCARTLDGVARRVRGLHALCKEGVHAIERRFALTGPPSLRAGARDRFTLRTGLAIARNPG